MGPAPVGQYPHYGKRIAHREGDWGLPCWTTSARRWARWSRHGCGAVSGLLYALRVSPHPISGYLSIMDQRFSRILQGLVAVDRERRTSIAAQAVKRITEDFASRGALGHGRLPVMRDKAVAEELEHRAQAWLGHARRAVSEASLPWTPAMANDISVLIQSELDQDREILADLLPEAPEFRQKRLTNELDAAHSRMRLFIEHELSLAVFAQDRTKLPLTDQLNAPRYASVRESWRKTHSFLAGPIPDHNNASKEAISAVEQLARLVVGDSTTTLGKAIAALRSRGNIPSPLLKGIEEIWAWASGKPGVRHGASATPDSVDAATAQYVVESASAALRLLLSQDAS